MSFRMSPIAGCPWLGIALVRWIYPGCARPHTQGFITISGRGTRAVNLVCVRIACRYLIRQQVTDVSLLAALLHTPRHAPATRDAYSPREAAHTSTYTASGKYQRRLDRSPCLSLDTVKPNRNRILKSKAAKGGRLAAGSGRFPTP